MKFVPKFPVNNIPALVQIMAWRRPGDKPLSEPTMVSLLTHICVTWPQWVNPLRPSDAILRWRSWLTLVQVMACCLTAPSHYMSQCWLIISKVLWHSSEDIIKKEDLKIPNNKARLKITYLKITLRSPRGQWVNLLALGDMEAFKKKMETLIFFADWYI